MLKYDIIYLIKTLGEIMENNNLQTEYRSPYNNPYILQQFSKTDLKWTKKKTKQYHVIKKLEKSKLFGTPRFKKLKNPFFSLLEKIKKRINYRFISDEFNNDYQREHYSEKDNLDLNINLEYLYVYDILPKEDIYQYHEGIVKYSEICKHSIGTANEFSIKKILNDMANHNYGFCTHNLGYFLVNDTMLSYKWIEDIYIIFEQYSESFYLITYRLKLKEEVTKELKSILTSLVLYEPTFHKAKSNRILSANSNFILSFNRKRAINELILEIEFNFINELNKYVPCFLHRHNIIAPSFKVYNIGGLNEIENNNNIMSLFDFLSHDHDKSKDKYIITNFGFLSNIDSYACMIKESFFQEESSLYHLDNLFAPLAEYLIFHTLSTVIEKLIIQNQQELNKLVSNSCSARKLLKAKIKTLRELNIYKRLISANQNYNESPFIDDYIKNFENCFEEGGLRRKYSNAFSLQLEILKTKYKDFDSQVNSLYQFYDDNLKAVESSTNIRLVRYTLIITAVTLLATILTILISLNIIPIKKNSNGEPPSNSVIQIVK